MRLGAQLRQPGDDGVVGLHGLFERRELLFDPLELVRLAPKRRQPRELDVVLGGRTFQGVDLLLDPRKLVPLRAQGRQPLDSRVIARCSSLELGHLLLEDLELRRLRALDSHLRSRPLVDGGLPPKGISVRLALTFRRVRLLDVGKPIRADDRRFHVLALPDVVPEQAERGGHRLERRYALASRRRHRRHVGPPAEAPVPKQGHLPLELGNDALAFIGQARSFLLELSELLLQ